MIQILRWWAVALLALAACNPSPSWAQARPAHPREADIPEALKPWRGWATWAERNLDAPRVYTDGKQRIPFWPSRLALEADAAGGKFSLAVTVFSEGWVPLPGGEGVWPGTVRLDGVEVPVIARGHAPAVRVGPGVHRIEGVYRWAEVPPRVAVPREIGMVSLTVEGRAVEAPAWDAQGFIWLKRDASTEQVDSDSLGVKVFGLVEDGIPLWLRLEVEMIVSGRSREEAIGTVLPAGWKLASVEAPVPVTVDDAGRMKAQVRSGKWTAKVVAFRNDDPREIRFAEGTKPAVEDVLVAFRARPDFRMVDVQGAPAVDVSQVVFPQAWRELPVYRWETGTALVLDERMRGMGMEKPGGLTIQRALWLDEDGKAFTFRDIVSGGMQQVWRLDAADGQELGSVRAGAVGQLITRNPTNGAPGVEVRSRNVRLEATGRMARAAELPATGWRADADSLAVTLQLPPGWRLFAVFGSDWVKGDWLTAWTLLDLFLLLVFSLAVFRMWGFGPAVLAFLAYGLSYHEAFAPRYAWLLVLVPLGLLRVVKAGWGCRLLHVLKWVLVLALILNLVPFVSSQVQQALYPQLERVGHGYHSETQQTFERVAENLSADEPQDATLDRGETPRQQAAGGEMADVAASAPPHTEEGNAPSRDWTGKSAAFGGSLARKPQSKANLYYDTKARIQTGPGVPEWNWRGVSYGWNGPVSAAQTVKPILIPQGVERLISVARVALLLLLAWILLGGRRIGGWMTGGGTAAAAIVAICLGCAGAARAQGTIPDSATLNQLRERLVEVPDAFPNAADVPWAGLTLSNRTVVVEAEVHAAARVAVPVPGRLPAWSPTSVTLDGQAEVAVRRADGFLWVVVPEGVHRVRVEGMLPAATEWEWAFHLRPRRVTVNAPGWTVTGVRRDGTPEAQVFLAKEQRSAPGGSTYERQDVETALIVERNLELGLVWQVRTVVSRLSPAGKAATVRVPLLPGENVLSSGMVVKEGFLEVRLGAQDGSFSWESELPATNRLVLATRKEDAWVECWNLVASPVWNVAMSGLAPTFQSGNADLSPRWNPWPGERVELELSRPEAIAGATMTVHRGTHAVRLGRRQVASSLELNVRCSQGEDFALQLPDGAEVTALKLGGAAIPVRMDGGRVVVSLRPGEQAVNVEWKRSVPLGNRVTVDEVKLPVEAANVTTEVTVPGDRWVLWTQGPLRGPAVRFWTVLACALIAAGVLGRLKHSPLRTWEWMLLALGLTQVPLPAGLLVVGWLFYFAWRGRDSYRNARPWLFNILQLAAIVLTLIAMGVFIAVVGAGLLGDPEMFVRGNGSTATELRWYLDRCSESLPQPGCVLVSIWWYRLLMLAWALWLAASLVRWLRWVWDQFSAGGCFRGSEPAAPKGPVPPPLPGTTGS